MASWCVIKSNSFRVKSEGKGLQERKIDLHDPGKSLEELETKTGLTCPPEKKKELLESLQADTPSDTPTWLENVDIPAWYCTATSSDVTNALRWGCELVIAQGKMTEEKLHDQLSLEWKKKFDQREEEFEQFRKISTLTLAQKESAHVEQLAQQEKYNRMQLAQKEKEIQSVREMAVQNLNASGIDTKIEKTRHEMSEQHARECQGWAQSRQELREQISFLQLQVTKMEQTKEQLQLKLEQKTQRDSLMNITTHKGDVGQELLESWLQQAFYGSEIVNTSKETGQMDAHLVWEDTKIIFDVKNHDEGKNLHSKKDINKFRENLKDSVDSHVGVLLCVKTHMPRFDRFWVETEIINGNKLAVYMNRVTEGNPVERLQLVAGAIIRPWNEYIKLYEKHSKLLAEDEFKEWADKARNVLNNGWILIIKLKDRWTSTQDAINTSLKGFNDEINGVVEEIQSDLASVDVFVELPKDAPKKKSRRKVQPA
jgi:hypothetical protein